MANKTPDPNISPHDWLQLLVPSEQEKEQARSAIQMGRMAAGVFVGALQESGSTAVASQVLASYFDLIIRAGMDQKKS